MKMHFQIAFHDVLWTGETPCGTRNGCALVNTGMMFISNIDWADAELPF
jgi:hypothetical protein